MALEAFPRLKKIFSERQGIDVVDSHTCGQPTRVILDGTGLETGMSPIEGRDFLRSQADWVRRLAVMEPRGHRSMFGAAIIRPSSPDEPFGVVYMDANDYPDMCGHATIGVATTLYELGLVGPVTENKSDSEYSFQLQTPAGIIDVTATISDGRCHSVAFQTPLAYYVGSVDLPLSSGQTTRVDVAWGGQYYAYLPVKSAGLEIVPDSIDQLIAVAAPIRKQLAASFTILDPRTGVVPTIGNIVWTSSPVSKNAHARNVPISSKDSFDRSPCGTATCARMAVLESQGKLTSGQTFVNESILTTLYYGRVVSTSEEGGFHSIVPQVKGSAWITAASRLSRDPTDSLGLGYLIGGGSAVM
jgi:proline racemase